MHIFIKAWSNRFLLCLLNICPHEAQFSGEQDGPSGSQWSKVECRQGTSTQGANAPPGVVDSRVLRSPRNFRGHVLQNEKQNRGLTPREMKIGTRTLITFEAAAKWRAEREAASIAPPRKPGTSASGPNENGCPAGTGQPKSSAFDVAHQNSQFAVRAPVAARSRLGAARRYRLRSLLDC